MFVTYTPEDGDGQSWDFDPKRVRASRAELIEKRFGESWDSWLTAIQSGGTRARRVLLWHLLSTDHPTLRWEDTPDFYASELAVEYSSGELSDWRDIVMQATIPNEQREQFLAALDSEIEKAQAREGGTGGKARSKRSGSATAS